MGPQGIDDGARGPSRPEDDRLAGEPSQRSEKTLAIRVVAREDAVAVDDAADGADALRRVVEPLERRDDRLLVRDGHVRSGDAERPQGAHCRRRVRDPARRVHRVEPEELEGAGVDRRRTGVGDGIAEQDVQCAHQGEISTSAPSLRKRA